MTNTSTFHQSKIQIKTEEEEIKRAIADPKHFDVLYNRYFLDIYKYVLIRVADKNIADDVVSRVFIKAMQKLHKFQFRGLPFSAWLYRVAYNELTDSFRRKKVERVVSVPVEDFNHIMHENNIDEILEKEELLNLITKVVKLLSEKQIELIEMRFFEQRSFKEMAEILNITEANAKVSTHRAINKIKQLMEKQTTKS